MATAQKIHEVLDVVERITKAFGKARDVAQGEHTEEEEGAADAERDDLLAEILDASEEAQAQLAAALTVRGRKLSKKAATDDEAAALAAVILRSLAAHSQAEAIRGLMESPDLSQFVNVSEDDETMPPEWDGQGGDDD